ncbi:MAG: hypothetical protein RIS64_4515 [Bacteroidota bacterium]|jgi:hypothetical protein
MKTVFVLLIIHTEEGEQNPIGVYSNKTNLNIAIQNLQIEWDMDLKENEDYIWFEVPFDMI